MSRWKVRKEAGMFWDGQRITPLPRWHVTSPTGVSWGSFATHAEALTYADKKARTVTGDSPKKTWDLNQDTIDQVWAEAVAAYKKGEKLYLTGALANDARQAQDAAIETDDRLGMVEAYLAQHLPDDWENRDIQARRDYLHGGQDFGSSTEPTKGTHRRDTVTNAEIWVECFNRDLADLKTQDSYAIAAIMQKIHGWEKVTGKGAVARLKQYGTQRIYARKDVQIPF